ncbi:MAG TPA: L-threonylcarbamoyladenylate synthase [Thermoanaerobaculia bacterium]|jgi:L-threonylcarbamoyladenylate synthase|nr:L-threonylcarbamoyladenylate synthase [Thermoanaerobaculia bacterium]
MTAFWRWGDPVEPLRELLRRGGVLAIPTESSYGLGADPRNRKGVEAIYRIKGREPRKALPVVVADLEQLADLGIDADLSILKPLSACWPGPLTVVLPIARTIPAAAGEPTLAVRIPGHQGLRGLLAALGHGLTATSANPSGGKPVLEPEGAADLLEGEDAMVVDGGVLPGGPPSTLVAIEEAGPVVLRTGKFPVERLREVLRAAQGEDA